MSYSNPLHPPLSPALQSGYSSLGGAVNGGPTPSRFISPSKRRLPQAPYTPTCKWRTATGRLNQLQYPITFDYLGYSKEGISMVETSAKGVPGLLRMIQGPSDLVLAQTGIARITFRIIVCCCSWYRQFGMLTFLFHSGRDMSISTGRVLLR